MSRSNLGKALCVGLVLGLSVPVAWAQMDAATANANSIGNAGVNDNALLDVNVPWVNDPASADILFQEGSTIASILDALKEKGFHIQYKEKHLSPTMTLLSLPKATSIDEVLREILEPWNLSVYRSPLGPYIVKPNKRKASPAPKDETHETLKSIVKAP